MITKARKDNAFADDPEHMALMVDTSVDVMFDPDHIHRDNLMQPLYKGLQLMQTIVAQGIATAIVSNVPHDWMLQYLQSPKLKPQFAFLNHKYIFTSGQLKALKPEATVFQQICKTFNLKQEEVLLIDETPANVFGARAVGLSGAHFSYTEMPRVLKELRAAEVITHKNEPDLKRELAAVHTAITFGKRTLF